MASSLPTYSLHRSRRRRTVEIQVRPDTIRVLAPVAVSRSRIDQFVAQKAGWISQRQQELQARLPEPVTDVELDSGSEIAYLGKRYRLQVIDNCSRTLVMLAEGQLTLQLSTRIRKPRSVAVQQQLELWYRQQAQQWLEQRVLYWSRQTGLCPQSVSARSYRRKWGCCNSRGELRFNWLLILAPEPIIDYVVIHELCHLQEMNHSPAFWDLVRQFYPEYKAARAWLNKEGAGLQWPR